MDAAAIEALFEPFGPVTVRRMFGGAGIYADGLCFAIASRGEVYVKADAETQAVFAAAGSEPFVYEMQGKPKAMGFWRLANPMVRPVAGLVPWWVLLETTGRVSGRPRRVPLASGPVDGNVVLLIAVHGEHSALARNIAAQPRVRLRRAGRWHHGTATLDDLDPAALRRFGRYARMGPPLVGIEPRLLRIELDGTERPS